MDGDRRPRHADAATQAAIERFLSDEAALLDRYAYHEWFALLTDDVRYRIATRIVRPADEPAEANEIVDETAHLLRLRVDQLADPKLTRAENPRSLYRRFVSNVRPDRGDGPADFAVVSNLLVYRNRTSGQNVDIIAGERRDLLRRVDGGFRIAARLVTLDQTVLLGGTLATLF